MESIATIAAVGYLLTFQLPGQGPILDMNHPTLEHCQTELNDLTSRFPTAQISCDPIWEPGDKQEVPVVVKVAAYHHHHHHHHHWRG
jgi:hypothetical protein